MSEKKYFVIHPDHSTEWIVTDREHLLDTFHKVLDCDMIEIVRSIIPDICLIVDESGKMKTPPKAHNDLASSFYLGWLNGRDNIVGSVVVAAEHLVDGEPDLVPLNVVEAMTFSSFIDSYYENKEICDKCPFDLGSAACWGNEDCPFQQ